MGTASLPVSPEIIAAFCKPIIITAAPSAVAYRVRDLLLALTEHHELVEAKWLDARELHGPDSDEEVALRIEELRVRAMKADAMELSREVQERGL